LLVYRGYTLILYGSRSHGGTRRTLTAVYADILLDYDGVIGRQVVYTSFKVDKGAKLLTEATIVCNGALSFSVYSILALVVPLEG